MLAGIAGKGIGSLGLGARPVKTAKLPHDLRNRRQSEEAPVAAPPSQTQKQEVISAVPEAHSILFEAQRRKRPWAQRFLETPESTPVWGFPSLPGKAGCRTQDDLRPYWKPPRAVL